MNESTARNIRVQDRYDELMRIGRHGHYETMFQVVREETEVLRQQLADSQKQIVMLRDALKSISAIEDKLFGPDWEEIDEARDIATEALATTEPKP